MKTVITSHNNNLTSGFDKRFGRAAWYCIYDEDTGETNFVNNENINATHGAGVRAAEKMAELKVNKVISGDFGPKAKQLLNKFNIQMIIIDDENLTVQDIINKIKS